MADLSSNNPTLVRKNRRLGLLVFVVVIAMTGLAFASVPLYRLFCQVTGIGGPAQFKVAAQGSTTELARMVDIRFNTDVDTRLPWQFRPLDKGLTLHIGQEGMTAFEATNQGQKPIIGTAIYNVLPEKAGKYFHKTQCFCFGEQQLNAGQTVQMPVIFYVDPTFADDPNMQDVRTITLSYTFYRTESPELDAAMDALQGP